MRTSLKKLRRARQQSTYHAWYSPKQAELWGTVQYRKFNGQPVIASVVSATLDHGCMWDDLKYRGRVNGNTGQRASNGSMKIIEPRQPITSMGLERRCAMSLLNTWI